MSKYAAIFSWIVLLWLSSTSVGAEAFDPTVVLSADNGSIRLMTNLDTVRRGELKTIQVEVCNNGISAWARGGAIRLGAGSGTVGAPNNGVWWSGQASGGYMNSFLNGRVYLDQEVGPGQCTTLTFDIFVAYDAPSTVKLSMRMVHDGVAWFGSSYVKNISVQPDNCRPAGESLDLEDFFFNSDSRSSNTVVNFGPGPDGGAGANGGPSPLRSYRDSLFHPNGFYFVKSQNQQEYEKLFYDNNYIYLMEDTSWDDWQCDVDGNGSFKDTESFFEYISDATGQPGGEIFPRYVKSDTSYNNFGGGFKVVGKVEKTDAPRPQCTQCYESGTGQQRSLRTCYRSSKAFSRSGEVVNDVLEIRLTGGPGGPIGDVPGERYFYGRNVGWLGFEGRSLTAHYANTESPREFAAQEICADGGSCLTFTGDQGSERMPTDQARGCDPCSDFHGNVSGCDATPGCAYYGCSNQCHPRGTSNCDAGCTGYCTVGCSAHHGNVSGCNAESGCAYYYCSNQCHAQGTSNCDAGCYEYCSNGCSANHGNVSGCNATSGCAYYYCSNQCHPRGTSNCDAGCSGYC